MIVHPSLSPLFSAAQVPRSSWILLLEYQEAMDLSGKFRGFSYPFSESLTSCRFTDPADRQRALKQMHGLYCLSRPSNYYFLPPPPAHPYVVRISAATDKPRSLSPAPSAAIVDGSTLRQISTVTPSTSADASPAAGNLSRTELLRLTIGLLQQILAEQLVSEGIRNCGLDRPCHSSVVSAQSSPVQQYSGSFSPLHSSLHDPTSGSPGVHANQLASPTAFEGQPVRFDRLGLNASS
jgi:hypothetical protein